MLTRKLAIAALLLGLSAVPSLAQVKIGVFDPNKLLTDSKLGQTLQEEINKFRIAKEAEIRKSGEELERLVSQYKASVDTMSAERREEIEADLTQRRRELERLTRDADADLNRQRQKAVRQLEQEVAAILEEYGKRNAYTLILQRDFCAYALATIDISDDLVRQLDARRTN